MAAKKRPWNKKVTAPPDRRPPEPKRDSAGRVRTTEAAIELSRLKSSALPNAIKINAHPSLEPFVRQRRRWAKRRMSEIAMLYGEDLTSGVGARIRAASWGYAFGEWCAAEAAIHGDAGLAGHALTLLQKASIEDTKATELATHEAKLRGKNTPKPTLGNLLGVVEKAQENGTHKANT